MEVLEHVDNVDELLVFLKSALKDGGLLIFSTINRTLKAKLLVKFAAEYILQIVPKGIHECNKFIKPSELQGKMERIGFQNTAISGLNYNPVNQEFNLCRSVDMNYFMGFERNLD
jgi:2-polyprenyl-6-hydroxyphenyl methylase / 3-demethylubiquinone-9 3-methyltransferase